MDIDANKLVKEMYEEQIKKFQDLKRDLEALELFVQVQMLGYHEVQTLIRYLREKYK